MSEATSHLQEKITKLEAERGVSGMGNSQLGPARMPLSLDDVLALRATVQWRFSHVEAQQEGQLQSVTKG